MGPDGETFALVAEYDAADGLEAGQATVSERGIAPQLAAFRAIVADRPSRHSHLCGALRESPRSTSSR
jgi:hypothetical protein